MDEKPRRRGDCENGARPCPWVSCRHHLFLDVTRDGEVVENFPGKDVDEIDFTCSLDIADTVEGHRAPLPLSVLASIMGTSRSSVTAVEVNAMKKFRSQK